MRIAIVNDTTFAIEALRRALTREGAHQVAWVARDGVEAVARCAADRPDLLLMDLHMPQMDGVEATRRIMGLSPCPILIVTASVSEHSARVFEALGAGAVDAVNTPILGMDGKGSGVAVLLAKIGTIGKLSRDVAASRLAVGGKLVGGGVGRGVGIVGIGCSAGGPLALATVLSSLPKDFAHPMVVVQHLDSEFAPGLASWLGQQCQFPVRLAREGDALVPGTVLLAGSSDHLVFIRPGVLGYTEDPKDYPYRPSIDVFFESALRFRSMKMVGVLLTGMGRDGAQGLKGLRDAGWHTIAQDQATSAVYGMPKAAAAIGAALEILPLEKIGGGIVRSLSGAGSVGSSTRSN